MFSDLHQLKLAQHPSGHAPQQYSALSVARSQSSWCRSDQLWASGRHPSVLARPLPTEGSDPAYQGHPRHSPPWSTSGRLRRPRSMRLYTRGWSHGCSRCPTQLHCPPAAARWTYGCATLPCSTDSCPPHSPCSHRPRALWAVCRCPRSLRPQQSAARSCHCSGSWRRDLAWWVRVRSTTCCLR